MLTIFKFKNFISFIFSSCLKFTLFFFKKFFNLQEDHVLFNSIPHEELLKPKYFHPDENQDEPISEIFFACSFLVITLTIAVALYYISIPNTELMSYNELLDKITNFGNYYFQKRNMEQLTYDELKMLLKVLYRLQRDPHCSLNSSEQSVYFWAMKWPKVIGSRYFNEKILKGPFPPE